MRAFLRPCQPLAFFLTLLAPAAAHAQLVSGALPADPARTALHYPLAPAAGSTAHRGTAALSLPFFDDFTTPREGLPSPLNWLPKGGAYVSNRLAVAPPSRGAATLDGLRATGEAYTANSAFGPLDSLVSQPINLAGLSPASNVRLSFAWQAGTVAGPARRNTGSTPVLLEVDFWDGVRWTNVWSKLSTGVLHNFEQAILPLDQAKYFHPAFQFRFRATGNSSTARDAWSVDYVLLDQDRPANDTTFRDIATSRGLGNPLRRYTAMPVWQFNAAPSPTDELSESLSATINNLSLPNTAPTPITWQGTVQEAGGAALGSWIDNSALTNYSRSVTAGVRQDVISGNPRLAPIPLTATRKTVHYELALLTNESGSRFNTLPNDTIRRDVELRDYYAYDDGTAESILALPAVSTGLPSYLAYRFDLNQDDQVRALRLYPVFVDQGARTVTVSIWNNVSGRPDEVNNTLARATFTLTPDMIKNQPYVDVAFPQPVRVSGSFWIGYGQPSQGRFLHYAEDLNSVPPANYIFQNLQGQWNPADYQPFGAPMMRPVMTNFVLTATAPAAGAVAFNLYPNPGRGPVRVAGPAFRRAELLDVLGRPVWQQPAAEAGQPTLNLPASLSAGLYLVRLTLPDGRTAVRRLVVE
jgi:hypothetical protein